MCKIGTFQRNLSTIFLKLLNIYLFSKILQKAKIVKLRWNILQYLTEAFSFAMKDWKYFWHVSAIFCDMWVNIQEKFFFFILHTKPGPLYVQTMTLYNKIEIPERCTYNVERTSHLKGKKIKQNFFENLYEWISRNAQTFRWFLRVFAN